MSILKGILHHWNKTTKSYDTIHPETESAQITDWHQGIVNTLTSDSLLAKMIQKVFSAAGLKYNIEQNGYICFGKNFGGLILQWGITDDNGEATFPIVFTKPLQVVTNIACGSNASYNNFDNDIDDSLTTTGFKCRYYNSNFAHLRPL